MPPCRYDCVVPPEHIPSDWWDEAYERDDAPWDTGEPQDALGPVAAREDDWRVLDAGCGTGTHAIHFARHGHDVVGVDVSEPALNRARAKAEKVDGSVSFRVDDVRSLTAVDGPFDAVVDSGTLHVFDGEDRRRYVDALGGVLRPGGRVFLLAFGADAPEGKGPTPVSHADVRTAFAGGWTVRSVRDAEFDTRTTTYPATFAVVERTPDGEPDDGMASVDGSTDGD